MAERMWATLSSLADHHYLGRYSIEKLLDYGQYQRTASRARVAAVLLLTPLPTALVFLAIDIVPMNDPSAGPSHNTVAFVRSTVSHALMTFFTLLPLKQAFSLSKREYSLATIVVISCCTALTIEAVCIPLAFAWRFPVPHREMIGLPVYLTSLCVYNFVFAPHVMRRLWRRRQLQLYVPIAGVQVSLFYLFLGLSVVFAYMSVSEQTAMIVVFPFIKFVLKHLVWKYARRLNDISTDVTICMLEVSGALYQTVCMQFVTSRWMSIIILLLDVLQAVHELHAYVGLDYLGDGRQTLSTALTVVTSALDQEENFGRLSSFSSNPNISTLGTMTTDLGSARSGMATLRGSFFDAATETNREQSESGITAVRSTRPRGSRRLNEQRYVSRSVFIPPSKVRLAKVTRQKKSRRLLNLDRLSTGRSQQEDEGSQGKRHSSDRSIIIGDRVGLPSRPQSRKSVPTESLHVEHLLGWLRFRGKRQAAKIYAVTDTDRSDRRGRAVLDSPVTSVETSVDPPSHRGSGRPLSRRESGEPTVIKARRLTRRQTSSIRIDGLKISHRHQARLLEQTLQLLFSSEVLLFAEYMEVVMPVLYALCLGTEWLSPNAKYNVVAARMTRSQLVWETWNSLGYSLMELLTLLAMSWFMRRKYGVSALYQLAFVLERYWMTLQGKLVGSFIVVINAITVHQGALMFSP